MGNTIEDLRKAGQQIHEQELLDNMSKIELAHALYEFKQTKEEINPFTVLENNYLHNTKHFHKINPFFYNKSKIFWFWNLKENKYEIVDEIDIMLKLDKTFKFDGKTINQKMKQNYIEAFKRVGRDNLPLEPNKNWIQFKDKIYDLKNGITKVTPNYFFTNPIPWEIGESTDTPTIDKLFNEWVGEKYVETLYEIISYCCYRDYPIQLLFSLCGSGRNGKSQFLKIIDKFIGSENVTSTELDTLINARFESFKLYKKLVCNIGETNFGILDKSSILKKIVGGDKLSFEKKQKDPFDEYSYAKIIIASNSLPTSTDTSDGFYRRWLIIDFPNEFEESGKDIINTIPEQEYNNLALKITKILPKLLEKGKFTNQGTIAERRNKYIEMSNPIKKWLDKNCILRYDLYISYNKAYTSYTNFLLANKKRKVTSKEFKNSLEEEGVYIEKTSKKINDDWVSGNWLIGLDLKIYDIYDIYDKVSTYIPRIENKGQINARMSQMSQKPNFESMDKFIFSKKDFLIDELYKFCEINEIDAININDYIETRKSKGDILEVRKDFYKIV